MLARLSLAYRSFVYRRAVTAARAAYAEKDFPAALSHCRAALAVANAVNSPDAKSALFCAMNRIRRAQNMAARSIEIVPMSPTDRARVITAAMVKAQTDSGRLLFAVSASACIALMGIFAAAGYSLPVKSPAIYDLIEYTGEESDIVDYNLTWTDCAAYLENARVTGWTVSCELAGK